jgi:hypothetical protein
VSDLTTASFRLIALACPIQSSVDLAAAMLQYVFGYTMTNRLIDGRTVILYIQTLKADNNDTSNLHMVLNWSPGTVYIATLATLTDMFVFIKPTSSDRVLELLAFDEHTVSEQASRSSYARRSLRVLSSHYIL